MAIKPVKALTFSVLNNSIGRKSATALSFFCDVLNNTILMVPKDSEHIDFAAIVLNTTPDDIRQEPSVAAHLVPVVLEFTPNHDFVTGMLTGTSGMEIAFGVKHTKEQLDRAHGMAVAFVQNGDVPFAEQVKDIVVRRWQA